MAPDGKIIQQSTLVAQLCTRTRNARSVVDRLVTYCLFLCSLLFASSFFLLFSVSVVVCLFACCCFSVCVCVCVCVCVLCVFCVLFLFLFFSIFLI